MMKVSPWIVLKLNLHCRCVSNVYHLPIFIGSSEHSKSFFCFMRVVSRSCARKAVVWLWGWNEERRIEETLACQERFKCFRWLGKALRWCFFKVIQCTDRRIEAVLYFCRVLYLYILYSTILFSPTSALHCFLCRIVRVLFINDITIVHIAKVCYSYSASITGRKISCIFENTM